MSGYFGDDLLHKNINGDMQRRVYFDSAATSLHSKYVHNIVESFMPNYGSFHSDEHFSASVSMEAFLWAKAQMLDFLAVDQDEYEVVFSGAGATSAINRLAVGLRAIANGRDTVLVSMMEHHSNDLPHRRYSPEYLHLPVDAETNWTVDVDRLEKILRTHGSRINYIAVTAASNVTGLLNPIAEITRLAHHYGVKVLVDGAQIYAHHPFSMSDSYGDGVDFFVLSGHKAHSAFAPGAFVARKSLIAAMPPFLFGGGMVGEVDRYEFTINDFTEKKEHAGTPNIVGAFSLGVATSFLAQEGMQHLAKSEQTLRNMFLDHARERDHLRIYGNAKSRDTDLGIVCFNIPEVPPNLVAAILNDHFSIAVRAGCFCAHPYVRELLFNDFLAMPDHVNPEDFKGMVRMSLGPHNTQADIRYLLDSLDQIAADILPLSATYTRLPTGKFQKSHGGSKSALFFNTFIAQHVQPAQVNAVA